MTNPLVDRGREIWTKARTRPHFLFTVFASVAAILLFTLLILSSQRVSDRADRNIGLAESQQVLIDKLATQLDAARAQGAVVDTPEQVAAEVPGAAEVSPIDGAQGERGEAGPPGPEGIGIAGEPGRPPTDVEVATAVAAFCSTGRCDGPAGGTGSQGNPGIGVAGADGQSIVGPAGTDGADSQVPGPQGPPGADSQVPGPDGPSGPQGPPPSSWTFTIGAITYQCTPTVADPSVFTCEPVI